MSDQPLRELTFRTYRRLQRTLPDPLLDRASDVLRSVRPIESEPPAGGLAEDPPWSSPNVWEEICDRYESLEDPTVVEYGPGSSTVRHVDNLLGQGGRYVGIEDNPEWYARIVNAVLADHLDEGRTVHIEGGPGESKHPASHDTRLEIDGPDGSSVVDLKLRPKAETPLDEDGNPQIPPSPYVRALPDDADIVVVDGSDRRACVDYILRTRDTNSVQWLVMMEAGRGSPEWPGRSDLTGRSNYQPEVERMKEQGGYMVDGDGVDRWPDIDRTRSPLGSTFHPNEACFLDLQAARETSSPP